MWKMCRNLKFTCEEANFTIWCASGNCHSLVKNKSQMNICNLICEMYVSHMWYVICHLIMSSLHVVFFSFSNLTFSLRGKLNVLIIYKNANTGILQIIHRQTIDLLELDNNCKGGAHSVRLEQLEQLELPHTPKMFLASGLFPGLAASWICRFPLGPLTVIVMMSQTFKSFSLAWGTFYKHKTSLNQRCMLKKTHRLTCLHLEVSCQQFDRHFL